MNHYCTLFNSCYLTRFLAMYDSLVRVKERFQLYVYCFDTTAHEILQKIGLPQVELLALEQFETEDLLAVKGERQDYEYCWTCTPHIILHALNHFKLKEVTYLDADLYFYHKPSLLLQEFRKSGGSIMITEHRFSPETENSETAGKYCVQFMTFKADRKARKALKWWRERCLEWCFAKPEDGKFGDQKYLDEWPELFEGVYVLEHLGGGLACWNVQQYEYDKGPMVNGVPVVFYHFTQLYWDESLRFDYGHYRIPDEVDELFYQTYMPELIKRISYVEEHFAADYPDFENEWFTLSGALKSPHF